MRLFTKIIAIVFILVFLINCSNENKYLIEKGKIGQVTNLTTVDDIYVIYKNDSVVKQGSNLSEEASLLEDDIYEIYSKAGSKLLEISPIESNDSVSKIKFVQIFDKNFKTEKGVSLQSTFKDINENYHISKVETTLTSATLFIDELNATISIDKKELGLSSFSRDQVTIDQIPDMAKIKFFTIWLN